jgi:hypothetical protein
MKKARTIQAGREVWSDVIEASEVSTTPAADRIPRGDEIGDIDPGWIPDSVRTINVEEPDGTSFTNINTLQFPDGSLTNVGGGVIAVAGGGDAQSIRSYPVATTAPTNGQVLVFNATTGQYEPDLVAGGGGDATSIQGHPVSSAAPDIDDVLVWNGTAYAPQPAGSGGSVPEYVTVASLLTMAERFW